MNFTTVWASLQAKDIITIVMSAAALMFSGYALWATHLNRGRLKMTQPTLVCLKRDLPSNVPKIFLRTLMFTTGTKGHVVESLFLRVHDKFGPHVFDIWGHTDNGKLTLGSGLFVGSTGVACDHHFNPRPHSTNFLFVDGAYRIEVFAAVVGKSKPRKLMEVSFDVTGQESVELMQIFNRELYLQWNAEDRVYEGQLQRPPTGSAA